MDCNEKRILIYLEFDSENTKPDAEVICIGFLR
jgi:hypothetical protein